MNQIYGGITEGKTLKKNKAILEIIELISGRGGDGESKDLGQLLTRR